MALQKTFPFNTASNYTFDGNSIEITGGKAQLKLVDNASQSFNQDFSSSTGFTFDSDDTEFSGGQVQQKDTTPANALHYGSYTVNQDLAWADGGATGTITGTVSTSSGALVISTGTNNYVQYDAASNAASGNTGAVRFRIRPNYSGAPSANNYIWVTSNAESNIANMVRIVHIGTNLRWDIYDSSGVVIKTVQTGNVWNPVSGTIYEIELNFDTTNGEYRLFIDGTNINGLQTSTAGTRNQTAGIIRIGKDYTAASNTVDAFDILDVTMFDAVQHTANYTPSWTNFNETVYITDTITAPTFTYSGLGDVQSFDSFTTTESGSPRYILNGNYWTGSAWASSDDSYLQASPASDVNTNISALTPADTLIFKVVTDDSNTQMSVSDLTVGYAGQIYPTTDPTVTIIDTTRLEGIEGFAETSTKTGSDEIKYTLGRMGPLTIGTAPLG